jgi:hypothetical protein
MCGPLARAAPATHGPGAAAARSAPATGRVASRSRGAARCRGPAAARPRGRTAAARGGGGRRAGVRGAEAAGRRGPRAPLVLSCVTCRCCGTRNRAGCPTRHASSVSQARGLPGLAGWCALSDPASKATRCARIPPHLCPHARCAAQCPPPLAVQVQASTRGVQTRGNPPAGAAAWRPPGGWAPPAPRRRAPGGPVSPSARSARTRAAPHMRRCRAARPLVLARRSCARHPSPRAAARACRPASAARRADLRPPGRARPRCRCRRARQGLQAAAATCRAAGSQLHGQVWRPVPARAA